MVCVSAPERTCAVLRVCVSARCAESRAYARDSVARSRRRACAVASCGACALCDPTREDPRSRACARARACARVGARARAPVRVAARLCRP
eukprot:6173955-Pleurochrysis_carterae.AAC.1